MDSISVLDVLKEQKSMKLKGNLYHITQIKFSYNTNHIEGSKLTEDETRYIYETNTLLTENNKVNNVDDIVETSNHFYLFDYMLDTVDNPLTADLIKEFHKLLKRGTSDERKDWFKVGEYKQLPNVVGGNETTVPENVKIEMENLLNWYSSIENILLNDIIEFHYRFESIHPFQDGNGRVGRIIAFRECLKNNIIPFIILDEYKAFYYRGLKEYIKEKGYLNDTILNMQDKYKELINEFK